MFMRYYWGLAIGHMYTHLLQLADDSTPHKSKSQSTNDDDTSNHRVGLEHHNGLAVDVDLLNSHDVGEDTMESSDDEEFWRHWNELVSNGVWTQILSSKMPFMSQMGDKGSDFDLYAF